MAFIDSVLQKPSYGWADENGELIVPTKRQMFKQAVSNINIFKTRKNWITLFGWMIVVLMLPFFFLFVTKYFSWQLLIVIIVYGTVIMGTHGTIWLHRYCTHRSFSFSHPIWRTITQNLVIKTVPEEMYVISHHVHHTKPDMPGDPYNSRAGLLYCMLAEVNHQRIATDLSESDYKKVSRFISHTGVQKNSFKQYQKWGSIATPFYTISTLLLNWAFWYTTFYFIGGHALACAFFTSAMLWFILVRGFNYTGHGKGKDKHVDGLDYDRSNLAINQSRPGLLTGEWHNNHHLYPGSARAGFLKYQLDLAWIFIFCMYKIRVVSSYHDSKKEFLRKYLPQKKFGV